MRSEDWACAGCGTTNVLTATLGCKTCSNRLGKRRKRKTIPCPECGRTSEPGTKRCQACRSERCLHGHPFTPENTRYDTRGHKICRACKSSPCSECGQPMRRGGLRCHSCRRQRCSKGHPFTHENTYVRENGRRTCRICQIERQREYRKGVRKRV